MGLDFWFDVGVEGEEFCSLLARVDGVTALGFGKSRNIAFVLIFLKSVLFLLFAFLLLALDLSTQFYLDFLAASYQVCDFLVLGLEALRPLLGLPLVFSLKLEFFLQEDTEMFLHYSFFCLALHQVFIEEDIVLQNLADEAFSLKEKGSGLLELLKFYLQCLCFFFL